MGLMEYYENDPFSQQLDYAPEEDDLLTKKKKKLLDKVKEKSARLHTIKDNNVLTKLNGNDFYDADSTYSKGIGTKSTTRLGDPEDSTASYVNAPEAPNTIRHKFHREPTADELARYNASMMAKNNYAMGTTPTSKEAYAGIINDPLTSENQVIYDTEMKKLLAEQGDNLVFTGNEGQLGKYGRQVGNVYNTTYGDGTESLKNRLLDTGTAQMYSYGKPIENITDSSSSSSRYTKKELLAKAREKVYGKNYEPSTWENILDTPGEFAAGAVEGGMSLVDGIGKLGAKGINALFDTDYSGEAFGKKDIDDASNYISEAMGVDEYDKELRQEKADKLVGDALNKFDIWHPIDTFGEIDWGNAAKATVEFLKDPSMAGHSLGYMGGGAGMYGTASETLVKGILKASSKKMAEKVSTRVAAKNLSKESADKLSSKYYGITEKRLDKLSGNKHSMEIGYAFAQTNDLDNQYAENNNGEHMSLAKYTATLVGTAALAFPEIAAMKFGLGKAGKDILKNKSVKDKVITVSKDLLKAGMYEHAQETAEQAYQEAITKYGTAKYKDKSFGEILSESTQNIIGAGMQAGPSGIHTASIGIARNSFGSSKATEEANTVYSTKADVVNDINKVTKDIATAKTPEDKVVLEKKLQDLQDIDSNYIDTPDDIDNSELASKITGDTKEEYANNVKNVLNTYINDSVSKDNIDKLYDKLAIDETKIDKDTFSKLVTEDIADSSVDNDVTNNTIHDELVSDFSKDTNTINDKINYLHKYNDKLQDMVSKNGTNAEAVKLQLAIDNYKTKLYKEIADQNNSEVSNDTTMQSTGDMSTINKKMLDELDTSINTSMDNNPDSKLLNDTMTDLATNYSVDTVSKYNKMLEDMVDTGKSSKGTIEALGIIIDHYKNRLLEDGVKEASDIVVPVNTTKYKDANAMDYITTLDDATSVKEDKVPTGSNNINTNTTEQNDYKLAKEGELYTEPKMKDTRTEQATDNSSKTNDKIINNNTEDTRVDEVASANDDSSTILVTSANEGTVHTIPHIDELKSTHKNALGWIKLSDGKYITEVQSDLYQKGIKADYSGMSEEDIARLTDDEKAIVATAKVKGTSKESEAIAKYKNTWVKKLLEATEGKGIIRVPIAGTINNFQTGVDKIVPIQKRYNKTIPKVMEELYGKGKEVTVKEGKYVGKWLEFDTTKGSSKKVDNTETVATSTENTSIKTDNSVVTSNSDVLFTGKNISKVFSINPAYRQYAMDIWNKVTLHTTDSVNEILSTHTDSINKYSKIINKMSLNGKLTGITLFNVIEDPFTFLTTEVVNKGTSNAKDANTNKYYSFTSSTVRYKKEVIAAIAKVTSEFMLENKNKLSSLTNEDIEAYYPEYKGNNADIRNIGIPQKLLVNTLGKKVMKELGSKVARDIPDTQIKSLYASAGYKVLQLLQGLDVVKVDSLDNSLDTELVKKLYGEDANTKVKVYNVQATDNFKTGTVKLRELYSIGIDSTSSEDTGRVPTTSKPKVLTKAKVKNSVFGSDVSKKSLKTLNTLNATEYKIDHDIVKYISKLVGSNKTNVLKAMGAKTTKQLSSMIYDDAEGAKAKNKVLNDELTIALDEAKRIGDSSVWFKWFETRNGRFILDSLTLNPQSNKQVDRWVSVPSKAITAIDPTKDSKENDLFKFGIAQAFGVATDKIPFKESVNIGNNILSMDVDKVVSKLLDGKEVKVGNTELEIEHFGQMVSGAVNAKRWQQGKEFDSTLLFEVDGITNGIMLKLLQFPIKTAKEWLYKGGINIGSNNTTPYNDYKSVGNINDAYQSLVIDTVLPTPNNALAKSVIDVLPKLKDSKGKVTSAGRNFAKPILMLFGYGASTQRIISDSAREITKSILNGIVKDKNNLTIEQKKFLIGINKSTVNISHVDFINKVIGLLVTKPMDSITYGDIDGNYRNTRKLLEYTNINVAENITEPIVNNLVDTFKELTDATELLNDLGNTQFKVYKNTIDKAVNMAEAIKGSTLTQKEKSKIAKMYESARPLVKSFGRNIEAIGKGVDNISSGEKTQVKTNKSIYGKETHTINLFKEKLIDPGASMGVFPIHFTDGTIMSNVIDELDGGITEVHDAMVVGPGNAEKAVLSYNKNVHSTAISNSVLYNAAEGLINTINHKGIVDSSMQDSINDALKQYYTTSKMIDKNRNKLFSKEVAYSQVPLNNDSTYIGDNQVKSNSELPNVKFNDKLDVIKIARIVKSNTDGINEKFYQYNEEAINSILNSEEDSNKINKLVSMLYTGTIKDIQDYVNSTYDIMLVNKC